MPSIIESNYAFIAGVDEAGRGPLAGPVVAAAVMFADKNLPIGIRDSKQLTAIKREQLAEQIQLTATSYAIAVVQVADIDQLNILQASLLAMRQAVLQLTPTPQQVFIDGNQCPTGLPCSAQTVVHGDALMPLIGAASILAKVTRDRLMIELDARYPGYGFAQHKGYPTAAHLAALKRLGACPEHRRSFRPVREVIAQLPPAVLNI
ncbi:ribonuclease HII [Thiospirillum jenense]|nr:ribonuclease HII [Thiospirillum jenense]